MSGDPTGGDSVGSAQSVDRNLRVAAGLSDPRGTTRPGDYIAPKAFGGYQIRTPVRNERGEQVGYLSEPAIPSLATGVIQAITGERPQVYTGDSRYNPNPTPDTSSDDGGGQPTVDPFAQQRAELAAARANRANALANKQNQLAAAFGAFNDDFYEDLGSSYSEYQNPLLSQSYDDSLRGIYEGFKAKGLLSQADVNAAISGLDSARDRERNRIAQGAAAYSDARRNEVAAKQKKLGDQLAGLVGGATTAADVNAQTEAINAFDFSGEVDKLKQPAAKGDLNFFEGFDKVTANSRPATNVAAVSATGTPQNAESIAAGRQATGIRSPYQGSSLKVVS